MKDALRRLLSNLDALAAGEHEEVGDTDVREQLWEAVERAFIQLEPDYELPQEFGMFTDAGNAAVLAALRQFFGDPEVERARSLATPQERRAVFQDDSVTSDSGSTYEDYFGWVDSE